MQKLIDRTLDLQFELESVYQNQLEDILASGMDAVLVGLEDNKPGFPDAFANVLTGTLLQFWTRTIAASAEMVQADLAAKQNLMHDLFVAEYIQRYGRKKLGLIATTTVRQVSDTVRGDMARGESFMTALRNLAADIPSIAKRRAKTILATESHAASQYASQRAAERSGRDLVKTWNSILDGRTRRFGLLGRQDAFNHAAMHESRVALTSGFSVPRQAGGFERLYFPGDPNGSAGNVINCRCIQTYERA